MSEFSHYSCTLTIMASTNNSSINEMSPPSSSSVYQLDTSLLLLILIASFVGLFFNVLCIVRYYRHPALRTHFTYVFHFILFYCLLASLFINPSLLIGYYGEIFAKYRVYCRCYG